MSNTATNHATQQRVIDAIYRHFKDEAVEVISHLALRMEAVIGGAAPSLTELQEIKSSSQWLLTEAANTGVAEIEIAIRQFDRFIKNQPSLGAKQAMIITEWLERLKVAIINYQIITAEGEGSQSYLVEHIRPVFELSDIVKQQIVIVLIVSDRTSALIVERELAACGYSVSHITDPDKAKATCATVRPDLVICNVTLSKGDGVQLAQSFKTDSALSRINFALLTSFDAANPIFRSKPATVPIIRKGAHFSEDLTKSLHQFGII
ncbi:MAG: response regulator [Alphaproteobacteria bacterium]|nr:response regulator [Alphaproteobacteria bacterium]